jgi:hypothetical protein
VKSFLIAKPAYRVEEKTSLYPVILRGARRSRKQSKDPVPADANTNLEKHFQHGV